MINNGYTEEPLKEMRKDVQSSVNPTQFVLVTKY